MEDNTLSEIVCSSRQCGKDCGLPEWTAVPGFHRAGARRDTDRWLCRATSLPMELSRRTRPCAFAKDPSTSSFEDGRRFKPRPNGTIIGIKRSSFARMFRRSTGETPHEFVLRQRIERAKKMLRESQTRVLDVAVACGFKTQQHFARVFRQMCQISPTEYRREFLTASL
jgi:AraC-like DNA-binding protein